MAILTVAPQQTDFETFNSDLSHNLLSVHFTGILLLTDRCLMSSRLTTSTIFGDRTLAAAAARVWNDLYWTLLGIFLCLKTFRQAVKDILDELGRALLTLNGRP